MPRFVFQRRQYAHIVFFSRMLFFRLYACVRACRCCLLLRWDTFLLGIWMVEKHERNKDKINKLFRHTSNECTGNWSLRWLPATDDSSVLDQLSSRSSSSLETSSSFCDKATKRETNGLALWSYFCFAVNIFSRFHIEIHDEWERTIDIEPLRVYRQDAARWSRRKIDSIDQRNRWTNRKASPGEIAGRSESCLALNCFHCLQWLQSNQKKFKDHQTDLFLLASNVDIGSALRVEFHANPDGKFKEWSYTHLFLLHGQSIVNIDPLISSCLFSLGTRVYRSDSLSHSLTSSTASPTVANVFAQAANESTGYLLR